MRHTPILSSREFFYIHCGNGFKYKIYPKIVLRPGNRFTSIVCKILKKKIGDDKYEVAQENIHEILNIQEYIGMLDAFNTYLIRREERWLKDLFE